MKYQEIWEPKKTGGRMVGRSVFFFPRDTESYPWHPFLDIVSRVSRAAFLRLVTGKNDNIGCVTGKNFNKIRGKIALLCHGCHGLHFFDLSRARKGVTGNFFRMLSRVKIRASRKKTLLLVMSTNFFLGRTFIIYKGHNWILSTVFKWFLIPIKIYT